MRQKLQKIIFDGEQHGPPDFQNINCGKCIGEHNLSIKEKIISGYLYKGFCTTEIANKMRVSSKLICNYRRAIKQKLDIRNHSDFILWLKTRTVSENYSYLTDCDEDQKKNNSDYSSLC
ncbi:LuxR C-terminal-related transcriptional regulator [Entomohabitans teleogrylli]|uniref:LuxR C-terminal-related transcriptional regulator n=1 Tax=Entomohabitans teleogrylli TaxID=1384589 RepID=UPI002012DC37|nr:LuxR C-terminal-related transcriptional regulator [Entomohabitans teleogrylli]